MDQRKLISVDNRRLFSSYYLHERVPRAFPSNDLRKAREVFPQLKQLYREKKRWLATWNEDQLREEYIQPILRIVNPHYLVNQRIAGGLRPDFLLFEREEEKRSGDVSLAIAVADAKAWGTNFDTRGPRDLRSPVRQLYEYFIQAEKRWGFLTDGKRWRLQVKDARQEFHYEINLADIIEKDDFDSFRYFYFFFRKEAFIPGPRGRCYLDDVRAESERYAHEVGEELKERVYKTLLTLAKGFHQRRTNRLDASVEDVRERIRQNCLILLYRLLFLFYAEDWGFLPVDSPQYKEVSLGALRDRIRGIWERDPDELSAEISTYWNTLRTLFDLVDHGNEALGVPPYNGGLFHRAEDGRGVLGKDDFLDKYSIGNRYLAEAIYLLGTTTDPETGRTVGVDYASLETRHLGSIYEGLLEYRLRFAEERKVVVRKGKVEKWVSLDEYEGKTPFEGLPEDRRVNAGDLYLATERHERRVTGSYYTPDFIVNYIVKKTVGAVVERKLDHARTKGTSRADAILNIRVCDPAMGSGHFLVEATEFLALRLLEALEEDVKEGLRDEKEFSPTLAKRKVLSRCIHGVDLNPLAVELAKVGLWLVSLSKDEPLTFLDHHLRTGNALLGADLREIVFFPRRASRTGKLPTTLVRKLLERRARIDALPADTVAGIKEKEQALDELIESEEYKRVACVADAYVSLRLGNKIQSKNPEATYYNLVNEAYYGEAKKWASKTKTNWVRQSRRDATRLSFFHWELQFPEVFYPGEAAERQGFDAIFGNPPYVRSIRLKDLSKELWSYYRTYFDTAVKGEFDIYFPFVERGLEILSPDGLFGYILPNKWLTSKVGRRLREKLVDGRHVTELVDFGSYQIFPEATTYTCLLFLARHPSASFVWKSWDSPQQRPVLDDDRGWQSVTIQSTGLGGEPWVALSAESVAIFEKLSVYPALGQFCRVFKGTGTDADSIFLLERQDNGLFSRYLRSNVDLEEDLVKPSAKGSDIDPYQISTSHFLLWPYQTIGDSIQLISVADLKERFPDTWSYLSSPRVRTVLEDRESGRFRGREDFYAYSYPRSMALLSKQKIVLPDVVRRGEFAFDETGLHLVDTAYGIVLRDDIPLSPQYLVAVLNTKLFTYFLKNTGTDLRGGYFRMKTAYLNPFPLRPIAFATPLSERQRLLAKAIELYSLGLKSRSFRGLANFIEDLLQPHHMADPALAEAHNESLLGSLYPVENYERCERSDVVHELVVHLADHMASLKRDIYREKQSFLYWLESEIGTEIDDLVGKSVIKGYDEITVRELLDRLKKNQKRIHRDPGQRDFQDRLRVDWRRSLARLRPLKERLAATNVLIDLLVYRLYDLTAEEIAIVEDCTLEEVRRKYRWPMDEGQQRNTTVKEGRSK